MKRVFNLLVVDESGSMSIIERQALVGINETLTTILKMQKAHKNMEQRVTLITFDSTHKNLFYDNVSAHHIKPLKSRGYNPCGGTPLYDAIGMGIAKINALTTEDDSVLVTIITDGEENCSEEYDLKMIKNLIEKLKKQNWTFTFIGTDDLDVENIAQGLGIDNHL
nr:vWA domain-containing protein [Prevotella sp.]